MRIVNWEPLFVASIFLACNLHWMLIFFSFPFTIISVKENEAMFLFLFFIAIISADAYCPRMKLINSSDDLRPFRCDICQNKAYGSRASLKRHQTYECENVIEKPAFLCRFCNKRFNRKSYLKEHVTYVHGVNPSVEIDSCAPPL